MGSTKARAETPAIPAVHGLSRHREHRSTKATPRALYEVVAVDRGTSLTMRDTKTGTERVVQEHLGSLDATEGQLMLTRVVESGGRDGFAGSSLKITLQQREGLMEVLDAGGRGRELLKWYGSATALPELQNREGEHLLLCHAEFSTPLDDEAVREGLSLVLHEEEAGRFVELTELDNGETILRSTVRTSPGRIEIETNSIERLERVTEIVTDAVGDVEVVDVKVEDPRELLRDRLADSDSDSDAGEWDEDEDDDGDDEVASLQARPEVQAALQEFLRERERGWIDESIPALGGLTPRQALDDPTRREDLLRLLDEFDEAADRIRPEAGGVSFDAGRIRALLGL